MVVHLGHMITAAMVSSIQSIDLKIGDMNIVGYNTVLLSLTTAPVSAAIFFPRDLQLLLEPNIP